MNSQSKSLKKAPFLFFIIIVLLHFFYSCENKQQTKSEKKINIVVTIFPLYDMAKNIGKEKVYVTKILPAGVEAHSFEPKPEDILKINKSDIFFYLDKNFETWATNILKGINDKKPTIKEVSEGIELKELSSTDPDHEHTTSHKPHKLDPHIWLDFENAEKMVDNITKTLSSVDPENTSFYENNAQIYKEKLRDLDKKYKDSLKNCQSREIIYVGHFAFGYLSKRYGLKYITVYKGLSPDEDPSPKTLSKIIKYIKSNNVKSIFYEEYISPRMAEMISQETNTKLFKLNGGHNVSKEELEKNIGFIEIMENNLTNLRLGLQCQ